MPFLSFSQEYQYIPFPDSGAVWSEVYNPAHDEENPVWDVYERFALSGEDTIIKNLSYKKLYLFYDTIFDKKKSLYMGGIREDNEKHIYYIGDSIHWLKPFNSFNDYNKEKEFLLYDFSLEIGDTLWEGNNNIFGKLIVEDIDTIQIENTLRKKFYFNYFWVEWIEGIGSLRGLLFAASDIPTGSSYPNNSLICFLQNNQVLYHEEHFIDCFPTTVSVETKQININIQVSPNPTNKIIIRFEWGNDKIETIDIFDLKGSLIKSISVTGKTLIEYSTEKLLPGIYLYKAVGLNNSTQTGKFVIQ